METSLQKAIVNPDHICKIQYTTCDGSMSIIACTFHGEQWYLIIDVHNRYRQRWVRLFKPSALSALVKSYGYIDSNGCLNKEMGILHHGDKMNVNDCLFLNRLTRGHRNTRGVPQRAYNSGVCWYCAMCFVMLFSKQMRQLMHRKAPPILQQKMKNVLTDKTCAESLRHELYHTYALGDRPGQDPSLDGQNGFGQLCILLAHLDIPTIRLFAPEMHELNDTIRDQRRKHHTLRSLPRADETSILVVRAFRTKWIPRSRIVHNDRRYKLIAVMIGSEHCGHQIGASAVDLEMCSTWALSDSDATQHGIGPMYWSVRRQRGEGRASFMKRWRAMWESMIPATLFGQRQVCDLNPINRSTRELEQYERIVNQHPSTPGVVNTDFIYMHIP